MITVVTGLPRTGTSMTMQMLVAGGLTPFTDNVRQPDDFNERGYFEHESVKHPHDLKWVTEADGHAVKVVLIHLWKLKHARQGVRVVFCRRSLDDLIESQERMMAKSGRYQVDSKPDVRAAYARSLADAEATIRTNGWSTIDVSYDAVVCRPQLHAHRLADWLGLSTTVVDRMADAVRTVR